MTAALASHRPLDVLEPHIGMRGAFACSPNALSSWAIASGTGRRCIYARAQRLPRALAERARVLSRCGTLQINLVRNSEDRDLFDYMATRTAQPVVIEAKAIEKLAAVAVDVLDLLERAIAARMPCPTNAQIGAALGGVPAKRVSAAICELRDAGFLTVDVDRTGHDGGRVITLVATGEALVRA
ncbi:hypothetical protein [Sphingomonas sp. Leaf4]|uniref:hypothetical protein n=1 Tax=Sphingomonas sp. Leaf4 TaxID=2876553 RepID=UPI001E34C36C|nr:hypothetical protein [Sphingomonas sp. Leaf4]